MATTLCSRERMLTVFSGGEADQIPCCCMFFSALRERCRDECEFAERQLERGLDTLARVGGPAFRFHPSVSERSWTARAPEGAVLLHRQFDTPAGPLTTIVRQTEDWPYGEHVPLFDDFLIPRAVRFPVGGPADLEKLRYLFGPPQESDIAAFRERAAAMKRFAAERRLLVIGGYDNSTYPSLMGMDAAMWLCGMPQTMALSIDDPDMMAELARIVSDWNCTQMEIILQAGVDLIQRRAWYESAEFFTPEAYRRIILPSLKREVELAHQAGARFSYIITSAMMPLLDLFIEAGIDAIVGIDPVQDRTMRMPELKRRVGHRICLWGGINAPLTLQGGTPEAVIAQARASHAALGDGGRFVLCPVENVSLDDEVTRRNLQALVATARCMSSPPAF